MFPGICSLLCMMGLFTAEAERSPPDGRSLPRVWVSYRPIADLEADAKELLAAGVSVVSLQGELLRDLPHAMAVARKTGIRYYIHLPEVTEDASVIRRHGLKPAPAVMLGGAYRGKAIDRHLFSFSAAPQQVLIEPPVYSRAFPYTRGNSSQKAEPIGHYFPEMGPPVRAEVVVPLKPFDGRQHLKILPARIAEAPSHLRPEVDSVSADLPESPETKNRKLYLVSFDLSGLEGAMLDHVGIAVYWHYGGSRQFWIFGGGISSAWAESTREALRRETRRWLAGWAKANGGEFPHDVVLAARFGDECFYLTGHHNGPAVSYPLWDFSPPSVAAFRKRAGEIEYPRTWGFPEIYGPDAYAWWLYTLHEGCAALCEVAQEEIRRVAPRLLLFRNTTRLGVFDPANDHDGSGQELLAKHLDVVHLDPYPVHAAGYSPVIPRDMSYCAGLARRYGRPLIPWMQAHVYEPGALVDVKPAEVRRMCEEQWRQGIDGIIWLGWGERYTFPGIEPESWAEAVRFQAKLNAALPPKPQAQLAALRPYRVWAQKSLWEDRVRNPADWLLEQFLEVWAVECGQPYDVFELPPCREFHQQRSLEETLKKYPWIVSTEPWPGAWVIGEGTTGTSVDPRSAAEVRREFRQQLQARGWLPKSPCSWPQTIGKSGRRTRPEDMEVLGGKVRSF